MKCYKITLTASILLLSRIISAAPITGQGTWESTLFARDLDGDLSTIEAYYDSVLNITWLADANVGAGSSFDNGSSPVDGSMTWNNAMNWVASLDFNGINGWRLPTLSSVTGGTFDTNFSNNASTDFGTAGSQGWIDVNGTPVSELGHMFYVTLGNLGGCVPDSDVTGASFCLTPSVPFGLSNTATFSNLGNYQLYWSDTLQTSNTAWLFSSYDGVQSFENINAEFGAWAVHDGDVGVSVGAAVIPIPGALWLFCSGFIGLFGFAGRQKSDK